MVRTQVQLTEEQLSALRGIAARRGISVSEVVREAVDALTSTEVLPSREERVRRALAAAGRFRSGLRDVSTSHDAHLAKAYRGS